MAKRIESVRRAKLVDEPIVRMLINEVWQLKSVETTKEDDYAGVDIKAVDSFGKVFVFDVKRNSSSRFQNDAFTFTYINRMGFEYNYDKNLVFIDELNNCIHFVYGHKLKEYIDDDKTMKKVSNDASRFVVLPLFVIKNLAYYSHQMRGYEIAMLERNREEDLFR